MAKKDICEMTFQDWVTELGKLRSKPYETFDPLHVPAIERPSAVSHNPAVSVIITTYNQEHCLRQTLDSVVSQKLSVPFEILLGEDCSTDGTLAVAEEYAARYPNLIRLITAPQNCNQGNLARLTMLARGKYIALCEGDDYWNTPDKLQKQYDALEAHPECSWSASDFDEFYQGTKEFKRNILLTRGCIDDASKMDIRAQILEHNFWLATCTLFMRSEILKEAYRHNPLFQMRLLLSDLAVRIECAKCGKLAIIPESLGTYRINVQGTSACRIDNPKKSFDFALDNFLIGCYYVFTYCSRNEIYQFMQHYGNTLCAACGCLGSVQNSIRTYRLLHRIGYHFSFKNRCRLLIGSSFHLIHLKKQIMSVIKRLLLSDNIENK